MLLCLLLVLAVLAPVLSTAASAGSVSGTIAVQKKGGRGFHGEADDAVVWLSGPKAPPSDEPVLVNQVKKKFHPRVLPVVRVQVVHFMNQDRLDHNVFSRSGQGFDLGRYPKGEFRPVRFTRSGSTRSTAPSTSG